MKNFSYCILIGFILSLFLSCDLKPSDIISYRKNGTLLEFTKGSNLTGSAPYLRIDPLTKALSPGDYTVEGSDIAYTDPDNPNEIAGITFSVMPSRSRESAAGSIYYSDVLLSTGCTGTVNVTIYTIGAIGEYCTGSFSGECIDNNTSETYIISDGYFKVLRIDPAVLGK